MTERYRIIIVPSASQDLISICMHIESQSPQNAAAVAQRILSAIDGLAILPYRFRVHESRSDRAKTVRSMPSPRSSFIIASMTRGRRFASSPSATEVNDNRGGSGRE